uniref:KIB1-4 beta-propeller domain-containing protein n=1 Tax=Leersia perrieri TaxID=77586 RepID=A0A0D9VAH1_9ORYZ
MAKMAAVDWSLLPSELIQLVGDCLLATEDFDCYDSLRQVCHNWRSGTADPKTAEFDDARFLPKNLAMINLDVDGDAVATFVNLATGRFLRRHVAAVGIGGDYNFVAATAGGLFVLSEKSPPHEARVLNPFTGHVARFTAPIHAEEVREVAVTMTSSSPPSLMLFVSWFHGRRVRWADQQSEQFHEMAVEFPANCINLTPFSGEVYVTNNRWRRSVFSTVLAADDVIAMAPIIPLPPPLTVPNAYILHHIVESAGELLLVGVWFEIHIVHKVDTMNKVVVPVTSLGSRALFVSEIRSFSVDAAKFPTVEAGCIYYVRRGMSLYDCYHLADGWMEEYIPVANLWIAVRQQACILPLTLEQVLVNYCIDTEKSSELNSD